MPVQKKVPLLVQEIKETPNLPQRSSTRELLTSIQEPPTSAPANPLVDLNPADKSSRSPVEQMKSALPASGQSVLHPNSNSLHPDLSGILETPPAVTSLPDASVSVPTVSTSPSVAKSSTKMEGPNKQVARAFCFVFITRVELYVKIVILRYTKGFLVQMSMKDKSSKYLIKDL
jgi:hypothetical protein